MTSPYTPPTTSLAKDSPTGLRTDAYGNPLPQLLNSPRKCEAGWGLKWLIEAFNIFKEEFLLWIGIGVSFFVILFVSGLIPFVGVFASFLSIVFIAGMIKGAAEQTEGGELKFEHLFIGFQTHLSPLLILALLYFVAIVIMLIPIFLVLAGVFFFTLNGDMATIEAAMMGDGGGVMLILLFSISFLIALIGIIPVIMAIWFAPALIILNDIEAIEAMKMSFKGCLKNMIPFLVYSLVAMLILPIVVILTFGLGFLVVYPILIIVYYTSYRDVWTTQPLSVK